MVGKIVVSMVSLMLVVGVVIGVIAVTNKNGDSKNEENLSSSMKAVTTFCGPTQYKDACATSLSSVAKNSSATPKDFLMAVYEATYEEVKKAIEATGKVSVNKEADAYHHMAVEDCKELLDYAVDQLQASISMVGESELHTLNDRVDELLNWLSAVVSYQSTCLDALEKPEYRTPIENGMLNASQLTDNAVTIVARISEILPAFNISNITESVKPSSSSRRLLEVNQVGHEDYPSWFPVADRKLMARHGRHRVRPHVTVAQDGSGQFTTINAAVAAYPPNHKGKFVIYVKAGVYNEQVIIDKKKINVFMYGDGHGRTIVTGDKNAASREYTTMNSATFAAVGAGFIAKSMTFRNTAGVGGHQAVALRLQSDRSAVFDCSIEGYQDSLYYQSMRQFYRNCVIMGTIDFIFGMGTAVIQNSEILVRKCGDDQYNTVTADGKDKADLRSGLVIQNCKILAHTELAPLRFQLKTYLARPWKQYSSTVVMQSELADFIRPEGYRIWDKQNYHQTCKYAEFANRGPGANVKLRDRSFTNWKVLSPQEAADFTVGRFINWDGWLKYAHVPFDIGL